MTMLMIGIIIGLGLTVIGVVGGVVFVNQVSANEKEREALTSHKPICGCTHHRSFHDEQGCHFMDVDAWREPVECGCKKYIGPDALELMP